MFDIPILLSLPYFDAVRFTVIDVMHNLFFDTGKRMFQKWIDCGLLTRENLAEIDQQVSLFQAPSEVGRLPGHISSQYGGFYGGQLVQPDAGPHTFGPDSVRLHPKAVGHHPNTVGRSPECCRVHRTLSGVTRTLSGAPEHCRAVAQMLSGAPERHWVHPNTVGRSPECCGCTQTMSGVTRMMSGAPNYRWARRPRRAHAYAHAQLVTIPSTP